MKRCPPIVVGVLLIALFTAACAEPVSDSSPTTPAISTESGDSEATAEPSVAVSTVSPQTTSPEDVIARVEVVFDGEVCTVGQPSTPEGDTVVVLTNLSGVDLKPEGIYLNNKHPDHDWEEFLDIQDAWGGPGTYFTPPWILTPEGFDLWETVDGYFAHESPSYRSLPDLGLADNQVASRWTLTAGEDWVMLGNRDNMWLCGTIEVIGSTESESVEASDSSEPASPISEPESPQDEAVTGGAVGSIPTELMAAIINDAVDRTGAAADELEVVRAESVTWSDGSLGCPQPGVSYTMALVDGYWIEIAHGDLLYDYRANDKGFFVHCEGGGADPVNPNV